MASNHDSEDEALPGRKPTRILLMRHAETSAPERFHGAESDVGLGESGQRQARAAARSIAPLYPVAVYSSGMRRAVETARPIADACGLETRSIPALHERRMGSLSGAIRAEVGDAYQSTRLRWESGDLDATHPGGESYRQVRERVIPPFRELAERHRGETVVVVVHGVVIRVLLCTLLPDAGPDRFERFGIDFVAFNDLRWDGDAWRADALNTPPERLPHAESSPLSGV
jgi:probable phosphoglycerate mutase